jgi:uncharacterized protein YndB with AHSA1/START domain
MVTTLMSVTMLAVTLGIVSVFTIISMTLTSDTVAPVSAQSISSSLPTEQVKVTREIAAPIDRVWNIVSDIDQETKYWSVISNIKNVNKTDNTVEREVTIRAGPQDRETHQFVTVNPERMIVQTNITEGPVTGTRVLALSPISDTNTTNIDVVWDLDMSGIPVFAWGFIKDNFMKTSEEALGKIAQAVE